MKIQIKSIWGSILFEGDFSSIADALKEANLSGANLRGANLSGANLSRADLSGTNLIGTNLIGANLSRADLSGTNLSRADLIGTNLIGTNLSDANLSDANLSRADLSGANLSVLSAARLSIVPDSGQFEGWKKCQDDILVRVRIPADAKRSNATGRKCRAQFVEVLEVIGAKEGISYHSPNIKYRVGETVRCHEWCEDRWQECAGGIHFFITRAEAEAYEF